ncbi:MAG: hypothetical protein JNK63_10825 [Chthonomonas sp.]|nr:hypothetical protein [Chthonomonas sp.]
MGQVVVTPRKTDPKVTEKYLMNLVGVVDASVYWSKGDLNAHVTVLGDAPLTAHDFQRCCMEDLGLHQTPRNVVIDLRVPRAA